MGGNATATGGVKVLSYNLFWWSLFAKRKGNDASAGKLIAKNMLPTPFDFMGFQECDDIRWVLKDAGLDASFVGIQGTHQKCIAYRQEAWSLLSRGDIDTAADVPWNSYGTRGSQWVRAAHVETGQKVFFMNHHGPLSVNSGGACGGTVTAHGIMQVMASNAQPGDTIILVGDFNANAASLTIQELRNHMLHVFNGVSFGGVDNVFSNADRSQVASTEILGSGGSDHDAISATIGWASAVAGPRMHATAVDSQAFTALTLSAPGDDWPFFWCGLEENNVEYVVNGSTWELTVAGDKGAPSPDWCCRLCQREPKCQVWSWVKDVGPHGQCFMQDGELSQRSPREGVVSGLPAAKAKLFASANLQASAHLFPALASP